MVRVFIRRVGESLVIGDEIDVTVLSIRDDEVRLAVATSHSAPVQVQVFKTRLGESLVIDTAIEVVVLSVRDDEVRGAFGDRSTKVGLDRGQEDSRWKSL